MEDMGVVTLLATSPLITVGTGGIMGAMGAMDIEVVTVDGGDLIPLTLE